ncbi:hypothetical protein EX30DRAFT_338496 [Ascodesmis nigricans]|uniref:Endoplasmic reticulum-based factor for assembly of V-ATPase-domain-containing protein n=1 Tax=Ascodesmis nigricans TaxID=341454 RepID=A0A4S2N3S6_9PEZI|nr:hypothetical protein EX30DRAFT_338496 [Ascodesmis nigricans]
MVHLEITPHIRAALALEASRSDAHSAIKTLHDDVAIDHRELHRLSQLLSTPSLSTNQYSFASLLVGTQIYHPPPPPPPPKSPEYVALMERLRREVEDREYHTITATDTQNDEEDMTWKEVKSQVTTIFNVLLSTLATAGAVWKVAEGWNVPERLAMAMVTAIVVCVAEVVLFWGFVRRVDQGSVGRKKEGRREVAGEREVVGTWEIGGKGKSE